MVNKTIEILKSVYLAPRFFIIGSGIAILFLLSYFFPHLFPISRVFLFLFAGTIIVDFGMLFAISGIRANRKVPDRLSNGDENHIAISILNQYNFTVSCEIIDEIPLQFQKRDFSIKAGLKPGEGKELTYTLTPKERGTYSFGKLNIYITAIIGLGRRRYTFDEHVEVQVYPAFLQLKKYELLAVTDRLTEAGIKKIRRLGQHTEFDQIKEYVKGDDYRTINWKATARKGALMVNQYQDEKSQQVYNIIDKGRVMKMPFNGMTLLDYSINASLVLSKIALQKADKTGVITFNTAIDAFVTASKRQRTMYNILETLYHQETEFYESNYELLYVNIKRYITQRSLLILYTNVESTSSIKNYMSFLSRLSRSHLLLVVLFENTQVREFLNNPAKNTEDIYMKTIAEKFLFDKKLIVKELQKQGIHAILTTPSNLTVNIINKYIEYKAVGLL